MDDYVALRPHQRDPVHVFFSYLAAAVCVQQGTDCPVQTAAWWEAALRQLTDGDGPWMLATEDWTRPAFLQAAIPPGEVAEARSKPLAYAVDLLDPFFTGTAHAVKPQRMMAAPPDVYVYGLVTLQTTAAFGGNSHHGASRVPGSGRLFVEVVRSARPGLRWQDAVTRLLAYRPTLLSADYPFQDGGAVALWARAWAPGESLPLSALDPFYLDFARLVRLDPEGGIARLVRKHRWIAENRQRLGPQADPWTPVMEKGGPDAKRLAPVAMPDHWFSADLLRRLIFGDRIILSPLHQPHPTWTGSPTLLVSGVARSPGKTAGFHQVAVPLPAATTGWFLVRPPEAPNPWSTLSQDLINKARGFTAALEQALKTLAPDKSRRPLVSRACATWEAWWQQQLWPWLWTVTDPSPGPALAAWANHLAPEAERLFAETAAGIPHWSSHAWESRTHAHRDFQNAMTRLRRS